MNTQDEIGSDDSNDNKKTATDLKTTTVRKSMAKKNSKTEMILSEDEDEKV